MSGFENALEELTLVLFTTLAPAGGIAALIMSVFSIRYRSDKDVALSIDQLFWIPAVITLIGLIASTTHLGNPSNALYVLSNIGSSPLSNEVAAAVVFLGFTSIYWFISFSLKALPRIKNVLAVCIIISAVFSVATIALAYNVETVMTWYTPFIPWGIAANGVAGGAVVALVTMRLSSKPVLTKTTTRIVGGVAIAGFVAALGLHIAQGFVVATAENSMTSASTLVPGYPWMVVAFAVCVAAGIVIALVPRFASRARRPRFDIIGALLVLIGIFIIRFAFYMMHLTVGL